MNKGMKNTLYPFLIISMRSADKSKVYAVF